MLYIDVLTEELRRKGYALSDEPNPIEGRKALSKEYVRVKSPREPKIDSRIKVYWTRERGIIC